jgi:hypothetical protein
LVKNSRDGQSPSTIYKIVGLKNEKIPIKDTVGFCTNHKGYNLCILNTLLETEVLPVYRCFFR